MDRLEPLKPRPTVLLRNGREVEVGHSRLVFKNITAACGRLMPLSNIDLLIALSMLFSDNGDSDPLARILLNDPKTQLEANDLLRSRIFDLEDPDARRQMYWDVPTDTAVAVLKSLVQIEVDPNGEYSFALHDGPYADTKANDDVLHQSLTS